MKQPNILRKLFVFVYYFKRKEFRCDLPIRTKMSPSSAEIVTIDEKMSLSLGGNVPEKCPRQGGFVTVFL